MASVSSPPRPVGAAPPVVRHGTCRLTVRIRGTDYRLAPHARPGRLPRGLDSAETRPPRHGHVHGRRAQGRTARLHLSRS